MVARRQVTNKLRGQYRKASKADKTKMLDRVVATTGMGRSTARRMLTGPRLADPVGQVDGRSLRPRGFWRRRQGLLLEHVWALMGMPCGKYLVVMCDLWLPLWAAAGDLDKPFATGSDLGRVDDNVPRRPRRRLRGSRAPPPAPPGLAVSVPPVRLLSPPASTSPASGPPAPPLPSSPADPPLLPTWFAPPQRA